MTYEFKNMNCDTNEFWHNFNKISREYKYIDALLNRSNINWWKEDYIRNNWLVEDKSFCLLSSKEPYFMFMGFLLIKGDIKKLYLLSRACFAIEARDLSTKKRKNINSEINKLLNENKASFTINSVNENLSISYLYEFLLKNELFKFENCFSTQIQINKSEEKLWSDVRTSFKSLINWGLRELAIDVYTSDNINSDIIESFRKLHFKEAGRETRSRKSWKLQLEAVRENEAFVVTAKSSGELVSAGYFIINKVHCFYGSSASKYKQFKKPLFHSLMWTAILHCKKRDIIFFETGEQYTKQQIIENKIDSKLINIAKFKAGFGGGLINKSNLIRCDY